MNGLARLRQGLKPVPGSVCFASAGALAGVAVCFISNWWAELPLDWCSALICTGLGAAIGAALGAAKGALADDLPSLAAAMGLIPSGAFLYLVFRLNLWTGKPLLYKVPPVPAGSP